MCTVVIWCVGLFVAHMFRRPAPSASPKPSWAALLTKKRHRCRQPSIHVSHTLDLGGYFPKLGPAIATCLRHLKQLSQTKHASLRRLYHIILESAEHVTHTIVRTLQRMSPARSPPPLSSGCWHAPARLRAIKLTPLAEVLPILVVGLLP